MDETFPRTEWNTILSLYGATESGIDDLDRKHSIERNWWFRVNERLVHVDLLRIVPGRHFSPQDCHWCVGVHCKGRGLHNWFQYSLPMFAVAHFDDTIFYDPHSRSGFATCELHQVASRARAMVSTDTQNELAALGLTLENDHIWPVALERNCEVPASQTTQEAVNQFCSNHQIVCNCARIRE